MSATITLEAAMGAVRNLALQVDNAAAVKFLAISSTLNDGNVEVMPKGGSAIAMSGPILLMGDAVALFASDLGTLDVQNKSPDTEATVTVLVGLTL